MKTTEGVISMGDEGSEKEILVVRGSGVCEMCGNDEQNKLNAENFRNVSFRNDYIVKKIKRLTEQKKLINTPYENQ